MSDRISDKDSDKLQTEIRANFRHKSDRMPGLGIKLQKSQSRFENHRMFIPLFLLRNAFFSRIVLCQSSSIFKDGGGPKTGGCIPLFFFLSYGLRLQGLFVLTILDHSGPAHVPTVLRTR